LRRQSKSASGGFESCPRCAGFPVNFIELGGIQRAHHKKQMQVMVIIKWLPAYFCFEQMGILADELQ